MSSLFGIRKDDADVERHGVIGSRKLFCRFDHSAKYQEHRSNVRKARKEARREARRADLAKFVDRLPEKGESLHLIFDGDIDAFDMIPHSLNLATAEAAELHAVSWAISRPCCLELLDMIDTGKLKRAALILDPSFRDKRASIYATALEGLLDRGQRMRTTKTHAKIVLLHWAGQWLTMETSANLNENKRIEQMTVTNDKELYSFHRDWMEAILAAK
jgi:hypothetical protein